MARKLPAKRATRANPREDRNQQPRQEQKFNIVPIKKVNIFPKSVAQENYLDALENTDKSIVIATGPAGTGKSYLATLFAIRSLMAGDFKKIIITRPMVSAGEDIGFLPGNIFDKLAPWSIPVLDIFKEVYPLSVLERLIKDEVVELAGLGLMRGRTLKNALIVFEECQNATPEQCLMAMTRIGEGSRMIITGDLKQHDRGHAVSGLGDFIEKINRKSSDRIAVCHFGIADIERHPVVEDVLRLYGEA